MPAGATTMYVMARGYEEGSQYSLKAVTGTMPSAYAFNADAKSFVYVKNDVPYISESSASTDGNLSSSIDKYTGHDVYEYVLELDASGGLAVVAHRDIRERVPVDARPAPHERGAAMSTHDSSNVWKHNVRAPGTPEGFTVRTTYPTNPDGVEVMLEQWEPGTEEPPHAHPGDDMTVVVEGKMSIQFYRREGGALVPDGERVILGQGQTGYVKAGRIHDAKYLEACKLVYVHDKAFGFEPA